MCVSYSRMTNPIICFRFESVYLDDKIRVAKDIRGDYLVVDRAPYSWKEWNMNANSVNSYLIDLWFVQNLLHGFRRRFSKETCKYLPLAMPVFVPCFAYYFVYMRLSSSSSVSFPCLLFHGLLLGGHSLRTGYAIFSLRLSFFYSLVRILWQAIDHLIDSSRYGWLYIVEWKSRPSLWRRVEDALYLLTLLTLNC